MRTVAQWGFSRQGLKCTACGFDTHRQCHQFAPACLGKAGSVASGERDGFLPARMGTWRLRICIQSADGLARKSMFRMPDPFVLAVAPDGKKLMTPAARKTLSPQWNSEHTMLVTPAAQLTLYVFDGRRYREGIWDGFLGMCIIPASVLLDTGSLGQGATGVLTFRLKKRQEDDTVTGRLVLKVVRIEAHKPEGNSCPIDIPGKLKTSREVAAVMESPLLLSTSPGSGWQKLLPDVLNDSPRKSLLPPRPFPPKHDTAADAAKGAVMVTWDGGAVTGAATGVSYTLAVLDGTGGYHDIYTGHDTEHQATGLQPGQTVKFAVKAFNFFGSSDYSAPSEVVVIQEVTDDEEEDTRPHCPMFMAGLCFRGAACLFSHGTGLQSADDVAAALMAASVIADPDVQMAAAMAASLTDYSRAKFDASGLPQYKRDFHTKLSTLRSNITPTPGTCSFAVSRPELFKSSFFEVSRRRASELKKKLVVQFIGEGGLDYGGLAREWFNLVSREIFHPSLGMFEYTREEDYALTICPNSAMEPDHLLYFHFVGRFVGLAVLHGHFIDASFNTVLCKRILGMDITLSDLQEEDGDIHRSMLWILENDITGVLDSTFSADHDYLGDMTTIDLIPNGRNIAVTQSNKHSFVEAMVAWRLSRGTENQLNALLHGLHEIIPRAELQALNERELLFLLCGSRDIDTEDWKAHTIYEGCSLSMPVVQHLWEVIDEFSNDERVNFLQFCTGSCRVPVEGFQSLQGSDGPRKFCVQLVDDVSRLPSAHTCFNRLDLPPYPTKQMLQQQLRLAVDGAEGFAGD